MNTHQHMTWELLLILGIVLLLISPIGDWLGSIIEDLSTYHDAKLNLNPFGGNSTTQIGPDTGITHGAMIPADNGGSNSALRTDTPSLWNVPIVDANGEAGTIQVVSGSLSGAIQNAHQGGNTPTGSAVPA